MLDFNFRFGMVGRTTERFCDCFVLKFELHVIVRGGVGGHGKDDEVREVACIKTVLIASKYP